MTHFGMFNSQVPVEAEESVFDRVTYANGAAAPRHRALDALATITANVRVAGYLNPHARDGDNFSPAVRHLVRCAAASPMFPHRHDIVLGPNPARVWAPGEPEHTASDYEQAPFADVWRVEHRSATRDSPMTLR